MPALLPLPKFHAHKADGSPAENWKVYTYAEGTSTPKASYSDFALTPNTNPVVLDARGEATIFLSGSYKIVLKDDVGATIWTVDSIRDLTTDQTFTNVILAGTLTISSTAVTWSGNPTHSGNHTFTGNVTVNGNTQLGNASSDTLRIDPNAVTWTNNPTHSGNHTFSGNVVVNGTLTGSEGLVDPFHGMSLTVTAVANIDSVTFTGGTGKGTRIGDIVSFTCTATVNPTAINTVTSFRMTPPIASAFADGSHAIGGGVQLLNASAVINAAYITADVGTGDLFVSFYSGADAASRTWNFWCQYLVL